MPSSPSTRTTPSSASPVSSARSIAVVTSPIVTNPRERPSATRSVNCAVSDGPLVTTVRLTRPVCPPSPRFRGTQFYYSDLRFNLRAICASTSGNVSPVRYRPSLSGAGGPAEQPLAALLKRDEVPEHPAVGGLVFLRVHPLQLRLDRGDLPADGQLPEIGRASCRERGWTGDWSSDVCSSDLASTSGNVSPVRYRPSLSGAGGPAEQPLAALLKRDEVPEHPAVGGLVFLRVHPLQLRLDRGDLPADGQLP